MACKRLTHGCATAGLFSGRFWELLTCSRKFPETGCMAIRHRETRFPFSHSVCFTSETEKQLQQVADADQTAIGVLIRAAFGRGWQAEMEARRKRRARRVIHED